MQGKDEIIELLNNVLTHELTAINQYFIHSKMMADWGYDRMAKKYREESIEEMVHADKVIDQILFLDGVPNMQRLNKVNVGQTMKEQFELDLQLEIDARNLYNDGIKLARDHNDNGTRMLLDGLLKDEEEHIDWLEAQLDLIGQVGLENYLAQHIHPGDDA